MIIRTIALALCAAGSLATAQAQAQGADGFAACEQAAQVAEATHGLPSGMLKAIGRVESGRRDPATGRVRAWPWTLNANGVGAYWPDQATAITAVTTLQARGVSSIDVGCFQINLVHHRRAFATLQDAFVPGTNADYAARFLLELRARTGDWTRAVMAYHSATPALGQAYLAQIQAYWPGPAMLAAAPHPLPPVAVLASALASLPVRIWTPSSAGTAPTVLQLRPAAGTILPVVTYFAPRAAPVATGS